MTIQEEIKNQRAINAAGNLIDNLATLHGQETTAQSQITLLQGQIKTEVAADNFDKTKLIQLVQSLEMIERITAKRASIKSQLAALQTDLKDPGHQGEIAAEVAKL